MSPKKFRDVRETSPKAQLVQQIKLHQGTFSGVQTQMVAVLAGRVPKPLREKSARKENVTATCNHRQMLLLGLQLCLLSAS